MRHSDSDVRLGADVAPAQAGHFRLVPGLAGGSPDGVSFESVNHTGHCLRHYDCALRPDPIDDAAERAFRLT